jgi:hypothetical protein
MKALIYFFASAKRGQKSSPAINDSLMAGGFPG